MVLIDEEGNVYDIWYTEGSKHGKEGFIVVIFYLYLPSLVIK